MFKQLNKVLSFIQVYSILVLAWLYKRVFQKWKDLIEHFHNAFWFFSCLIQLTFESFFGLLKQLMEFLILIF